MLRSTLSRFMPALQAAPVGQVTRMAPPPATSFAAPVRASPLRTVNTPSKPGVPAPTKLRCPTGPSPAPARPVVVVPSNRLGDAAPQRLDGSRNWQTKRRQFKVKHNKPKRLTPRGWLEKKESYQFGLKKASRMMKS
jgi:hypothetical protein